VKRKSIDVYERHNCETESHQTLFSVANELLRLTNVLASISLKTKTADWN